MGKGKKVLAVLVGLAAVVVLAVLVGMHIRVNRMQSPDDFLPLVQRTVGVDSPLTVLGDYQHPSRDDIRLLLCYTTDFTGRADFYAVRLEKGWLQYQGYKVSVVERGPDIYIATWARGSILISGNPDAAYIELKRITPAGETVQIPVTSVPFAYYWDWSVEPWATDATSFSYEYFFYNHAGEALTK